MKATRIYINGDYNENDTMNIEVVKQQFTGEGSADFVNTTIFKGVKEFRGIADMEEMSDADFDALEKNIMQALKDEFASDVDSNDFYYNVV